MKLTTGMIAVLCFTFVAVVALVAGLIALGKDPSQLVSVLATVLIPTIVSLVGLFKSNKAAMNAEQAVHNTNGRMGQLIGGYIAAGLPIPPGYEEVTPILPDGTKVETGRHAE